MGKAKAVAKGVKKGWQATSQQKTIKKAVKNQERSVYGHGASNWIGRGASKKSRPGIAAKKGHKRASVAGKTAVKQYSKVKTLGAKVNKAGPVGAKSFKAGVKARKAAPFAASGGAAGAGLKGRQMNKKRKKK